MNYFNSFHEIMYAFDSFKAQSINSQFVNYSLNAENVSKVDTAKANHTSSTFDDDDIHYVPEDIEKDQFLHKIKRLKVHKIYLI